MAGEAPTIHQITTEQPGEPSLRHRRGVNSLLYHNSRNVPPLLSPLHRPCRRASEASCGRRSASHGDAAPLLLPPPPRLITAPPCSGAGATSAAARRRLRHLRTSPLSTPARSIEAAAGRQAIQVHGCRPEQPRARHVSLRMRRWRSARRRLTVSADRPWCPLPPQPPPHLACLP